MVELALLRTSRRHGVPFLTDDKVSHIELSAEFYQATKWAYTIRHVDRHRARFLLTGELRPETGDLVLARVLDIGQHSGIQLAEGRRSSLFRGDIVAVCYGNRYAPDQFEAEVPNSLEPCHLVAAGGVAARMLTRHKKMKAATRIEPLGLLAEDKAKPLNIRDFGLGPAQPNGSTPPVIASVGTCMNSGKTTSGAHMVRGLTAAGLRIAAAKVTGTGSPRDPDLMRDAGANPVLDFTDIGMSSTYLAPDREIERGMSTLIAHLSRANVDGIVLEIADGLLHRESASLIESVTFGTTVDGVLFSAADAMSAKFGLDWLHQKDLNVLGVAGVINNSPLGIRELQTTTNVRVITLTELSDPDFASEIYRSMAQHPARASGPKTLRLFSTS